MKATLLAILLLAAGAAPLRAQEAVRPTTLSLEGGGGYTRFLTDADIAGLSKSGFAGTVRLMWKPEHLLSLGLETGYQYLYSVELNNVATEFGTTNFNASMTTVPIMIAFAMRVTPEVRLRAATGMYLLSNTGEIFGDDLESSELSIGMGAGASYTVPIGERLSLGGELRYSYISKIQESSLGLQILLEYQLFEL